MRSGVSPNVGGRWGDYFSVTVDPADDTTFWGHGEVTRADGLWSTEMVSWVVSTPGINTEYDPANVAAFVGTPSGGGLPQVILPDNAYFSILSAEQPGLGYFAGSQSSFFITETPADVDKLTLSVEAHATLSASVTGTLYFWNWTTSQFEYANAFTITGTDTQGSAPMTSNLTNYIGPGGEVRTAFRAHDPYRRAGNRAVQFTFNVDYIHLTVNSSP
jgi:hypothetical protein